MSEENMLIIKQINKFGRVLRTPELLKMIEDLEQERDKYKEVIDRLNFIKNRKNQGASQENINKMAIEFVNSYLKEVSE